MQGCLRAGHRSAATARDLAPAVAERLRGRAGALARDAGFLEADAGDDGIGVKSFASDRSRIALRTRVHATVFRDFGRPDERVERHVLTLDETDGMRDIGLLAVE